jgi:hypothetical protein
MSAENKDSEPVAGTALSVASVVVKTVSPAAARALAEAAARRAQQVEREAALAAHPEHKGRGGHDPVRYNDWEIKGLTSDF